MPICNFPNNFCSVLIPELKHTQPGHASFTRARACVFFNSLRHLFLHFSCICSRFFAVIARMKKNLLRLKNCHKIFKSSKSQRHKIFLSSFLTDLKFSPQKLKRDTSRKRKRKKKNLIPFFYHSTKIHRSSHRFF